MIMLPKNKTINNSKNPAYSKQQILLAKKYRHRKDILNVLLEDVNKYTMQQVDELLEKFMKGKVK